MPGGAQKCDTLVTFSCQTVRPSFLVGVSAFLCRRLEILCFIDRIATRKDPGGAHESHEHQIMWLPLQQNIDPESSECSKPQREHRQPRRAPPEALDGPRMRATQQREHHPAPGWPQNCSQSTTWSSPSRFGPSGGCKILIHSSKVKVQVLKTAARAQGQKCDTLVTFRIRPI